ncbi:MAG: hypothetical protein A3J05_04250 [Candidatus Doudnabacteria bacterium RIFCSPLOWO2_02_FULL_48_13]|uniref:Transcobalamin-like C-terminal domain-containing protein n=1 Tax=Candidatus Doudnabacteria bacterium RIFCSPLOWO2_02_FULL_48_13 TaxID=1817845 RepID=A0A1F5Q8X2_9BACT|nr:MAG: hypothetical protein A3J05_04250 [Candidatus Doudnabacteria bacterium RIFCSPLOWO2_02_FULL_48_13]
MQKTLKRIIILLVVAALIGGLAYYVKSRPAIQYEQGLYPVNPELAGETIIQTDYVRYVGKDGQNALILLKDTLNNNIVVKEYDFGVFVESIGGNKPDANHFWKLYYNGKEAQVASDKLVTKKGDVLEWVVEKINK